MPAATPQDTHDKDRAVQSQAPQDSQIVNQVWRSKRLDELEHALNTQISPQRFVNASAGDHADGMLAFRGQGHFGIFQLRIGRDIDVLLDADEADDRTAFIMAASGAGEVLFNKKEFSHSTDRAVIFPSGPERRVKFAQGTEIKVFMTDRVKIAECCAKLLGHDVAGFVSFDVSADLESAAGRSWLRLLSYAEAELADPHSFIRHSPVAWRQFEQQLLTGFLLSHQHDYSQALLAPQAAAVPFYVKRAEAYIEAHFAEPLSLAEIAAQAGVSARSLQSGFQNFRNITPMGFLRAVRLQRAHEALLTADPAVVTVTQVALACGFAHLGEFGTTYRRVFGMTPSQTLHKKLRL